ncbi:MAG: phosphoribosylamine--glycine ligase, partial [Elusimicrobia bacterium]|nr:phosphoribosylamine--glycine ligase [Elusimicrobiota bacterium]
ENVNIKADDIAALSAFAKENEVGFTFVGPEIPLAQGIVDHFEKNCLKIFGPSQKGAMLEASKDFSKKFMIDNHIPTAAYSSFDNSTDALKYLESFDAGKKLVVKADGLAAGKGVYICQNIPEAQNAVKEIMETQIFGASGSKIVIEEFLEGFELSVLMFTDGESYKLMPAAQDHKRVFDNDQGPNTGGMGAYAPAPSASPELMQSIDGIVLKIMQGIKKENIDYRGILYVGFLVSGGVPYVLEFNCRFGDPETQVLLPLLKTDLSDICHGVIDKKLKDINVEWSADTAVTVVLASGGYPGEFKNGYEITGTGEVDKNCTVYHAGTKNENGKLLTAGGRVLAVTAVAENIADAVKKVYENVEKINFTGMHYRKDIAKRALR